MLNFQWFRSWFRSLYLQGQCLAHCTALQGFATRLAGVFPSLRAVLQSIEPEPRSCTPRGFADYWTRQLCAFARILHSGKIRTLIGWQYCRTLLLVECNLTLAVLIFRERDRESERKKRRGVSLFPFKKF